VNELLRVESAAANLDGGQLTTTYRDNIGDKGVDAGLRRAVATRYIPSGDSAWQFKAGDLPPSKCKNELRGASAALDVVRAGGTYRLVLGADLTDTQVRNRRVALEEEAAELGIDVQFGMFQILNGSDLAAWTEEHPALAVSPLLHGIDNVAHPFAEWSASNRLTGPWVDAPSRDSITEAVREFVTGSNMVDLHIEGVSGIGKTRAVLEAIRGQDFEPLVAHVYAADVLPPTLIHQLQTKARHTILVVDECDAKRHETLAHQLPAGSPVKLITIGEPTGYRPRVAPVTIEPLEGDALRRVVRENQSMLWPEHARFVVDASAGNVRLALILADDIVKQPSTTANDLITLDIIKSYVTQALPMIGRERLACCALALFPYFGYDGEPSAELATLAAAFELTVTDLRAAARTLADAGLLSEQGRYRSVSPHPLAIYLATRGWEDFHDHIVTRLLPTVDASVATRLFQRAADIGDFQVTKDTVAQLLAPGGLYENVDVWGSSGEALLILHFAALAPVAVCGRVEAVVAAMTDDELSDHSGNRQSVTWVLERLAWRTATFQRAASALLRVAAATPSPGSDHDAAARSWTDLFGTMLPTTAASPAVRAQYLRDVITSADRRHRLLAVAAAGRVLDSHEMVLASSEMQGGVLLEHRGAPATGEDAFTYRAAAIDALAVLAWDDDPEIANVATSQLAKAIHPFLKIDRIRSHLGKVFANLPEIGLAAARTEITHLTALFERVNTGANNDIDARKQGLDAFGAQLPPPTPEQTLEFLANTRRWDLADGELQQRLTAAAAAIPVEDRVSRLLSALDRQPAAAYELGHTLGELAPNNDDVRERLVTLAATEEEVALVGYLYAPVEDGASDAFDQLLDSDSSSALGDFARLRVSVRGPQSDAGWARVSALITQLNPRDGARGLLGWYVDLAPERLRDFLADWLPRIDTQDDYNAVVDFVALAVHRRPEWIDSVDPLVADLVALRSRFGRLTGREWDWEQLARRQPACTVRQVAGDAARPCRRRRISPSLGIGRARAASGSRGHDRRRGMASNDGAT
jgi:hypothetical protein